MNVSIETPRTSEINIYADVLPEQHPVLDDGQVIRSFRQYVVETTMGRGHRYRWQPRHGKTCTILVHAHPLRPLFYTGHFARPFAPVCYHHRFGAPYVVFAYQPLVIVYYTLISLVYFVTGVFISLSLFRVSSVELSVLITLVLNGNDEAIN